MNETIENIKEGNDSANRTAKQLEAIVEGSTKVASFLDEIALASREQAEAVDQVTEGLDQIDQVTQANTASAEESASAAEELSSQAQELKQMIGRFQLKSDMGSTGGATPVVHRQAQKNVRPGVPNTAVKRKQIQPPVTSTTPTENTAIGTKKTTSMPESGVKKTASSDFHAEVEEADDTSRLKQREGKEETGIKPVNPAEVIKLDDDDFDRF